MLHNNVVIYTRCKIYTALNSLRMNINMLTSKNNFKTEQLALNKIFILL